LLELRLRTPAVVSGVVKQSVQVGLGVVIGLPAMLKTFFSLSVTDASSIFP
jgi:hypothetical protein